MDRPGDRFAISVVAVSVYDVNDHSPAMSAAAYTAQVREGAPVGAVVTTVSATDLDMVSTR